MATTDQRNKRTGGSKGTSKGGLGSAARGARSAAPVVPAPAPRSPSATLGSEVSADSLTEALLLLESFVSGFEPGRYSGEDASVLMERFARGERLCATGKALAAKRATETELHRKDGSRSAAEWLAKRTGESLGQAADSLKLANRMEDHGELADALRAGELSLSRARQIADVLTLDPTSEDELVKAGKNQNETNRQLADRCLSAKAKARSGEDNRAAYGRIRAGRYLRHFTDANGAFRLEGAFTPDAGAKLLAALKPTRTVLFDEARKLGVRERPDAYEADALVALLTGERPPAPKTHGVRDSGPGARSNESQPGAENHPDASNGAHAGPQDDQRPSPGPQIGFPPPASVHLRVDLAALRRGHIVDGECCEIPGVGPVPIETAIEVLGDALVHLVITNGEDIASVTHVGRTIRAPLREALIERDQTCVVPGCGIREGLEIDHRIIPVVENGETALWNLARLCRHHHYLRHHQGFRLDGGPGDWQWIPPESPLPEHPDETGCPTDHDRLFELE